MKKPNTNDSLLGLIGLASVVFASLGYVYGHKSFSADTLAGMLTSLWQILTALAIISLAGGLGTRLLGGIQVDGLIRMGLATALGMTVLSVALLIVGSLGGTDLFFIIFLTLSAFILRKDILAWIGYFREIASTRPGKFGTAVIFGSIFILAAELFLALAPPTGFDALVYHFAIPARYVQLGHIAYIQDSIFWGMPQTTEMLYMAALRFAEVESAAVISTLIGGITLLGMWAFANYRFSGIAAWTAIAAILAGETLCGLMSFGYVEWTAMLYGWAAFVAVDLWLNKHEGRMLLLAGIFSGAALGTKYTAGIVVLTCLIALAVLQRNQPWALRLRNLTIFGVMALVTTSPWWIKNFLAAGNPFYPFLFPAGAMDEMRLNFYQGSAAWKDWQAVVLIPWQATIWGIEGKEGFSASIGPILVALSPLAWINCKSRTDAQRMAILVAVTVTITGLAIWATASRISGLLIQTRLYFAIFPAWALLAGVGLDALWQLHSPTIRFGRLAGALALFMFTLNTIAVGTDLLTRDPFRYLIGLESSDDYLYRNMGAYAVAMQSVADLPLESRVLMLWEARGYYCQPRCDSDEVIDRWFHDASLYSTSREVIESWRNQGFTHVLFYSQGAAFVREENPRTGTNDWPLLDETLKQLTIEKDIAGAYTLYLIPMDQP